MLVCSGDAIALRKRQRAVRDDSQLGILTKPFSVDQVELAIAKLQDAHRVPEWDDEREFVLVADAMAELIDGSSAMLRACSGCPSRRCADTALPTSSIVTLTGRRRSGVDTNSRAAGKDLSS
ncbi:MAG: hypothetical protein ACR2GO_02205 [Candidatus Limnocylindria bacterium]